MAAVTATTSARRFEELIAGRPYLIEVVPVSQDRWRAYIVRIPGVPNAMMPFYGRTPDEAAAQLRQWLTRAYERAATAVRRV
jgi:IS1 family transposase